MRLTGGAGIGKNLAVGEGLRVYGGTELTGALDLNSNANISGTLVQGGVATFQSNVNVIAGNGGATKVSVFLPLVILIFVELWMLVVM